MKKKIIIVSVCTVILLIIFLLRVKLIRIISPFLTAFFISFLAYPFVRMFRNRTVGIVLFYCMFVASFFGLVSLIVPAVAESISEIDIVALKDRVLNAYKGFLDFLGLPEQTMNIDWIPTIMTPVYSLFDVLTNLILGLTLSFYFLKDEEIIVEGFKGLVPAKYRDAVCRIFIDLGECLSGFIRGQMLLSLALFLCVGIVLYLFRVKNAILLAFITAVFDVVPYFGAIISFALVLIITYISSPESVWWVMLILIVIEQLEGNILKPKITGRHVGISPPAAILAIICGAEFGGLLGILLAIPIFGMIKVIYTRVMAAVT